MDYYNVTQYRELNKVTKGYCWPLYSDIVLSYSSIAMHLENEQKCVKAFFCQLIFYCTNSRVAQYAIARFGWIRGKKKKVMTRWIWLKGGYYFIYKSG